MKTPRLFPRTHTRSLRRHFAQHSRDLSLPSYCDITAGVSARNEVCFRTQSSRTEIMFGQDQVVLRHSSAGSLNSNDVEVKPTLKSGVDDDLQYVPVEKPSGEAEMEQKEPDGPEALFTKPGRFSDVTLKVEGKELYASKFLLAAVSPVFDAMFTHDFKEKTAENIELPGKKYVDVLELLLQIHPSLRKPVTGALALQLYPLCHEYQMKVEEDRCQEALLSTLNRRPVSTDFHRSCVELTCIYDLPEIHEVCVNIAINDPRSYFNPFVDKLEETPLPNIKVLITKMRVKIEGAAVTTTTAPSSFGSVSQPPMNTAAGFTFGSAVTSGQRWH